MTIRRPLVSVICCAHDEEEYVDAFMKNLVKALGGFSSEVIFVADRCTDGTVERVQRYGKFGVKVIEKNWRNWVNSYAESLHIGYLNAKGKYVCISDVDILLPNNFFRNLTPLLRGKIASVAAHIVTYPDTLLNRVKYALERTYSLAPLGSAPYGAARILSKKALDRIEGFRDVPAPDTDIDIRLVKKGYRSVAMSAVKVYHMRHLSLGKIVGRQITSGRGRYVLSVGFMRTMGHAVFRFRPFVVAGWLMEWMKGGNC